MAAAFTQQIRPVSLPSAIVGLPNGDFPDDVLVDVFDADGTRVGRLCEPAAQAYQALVAAAAADGVDIRPTSSADTYRPLEVQVRLFESRYEVGGPGGGCKSCAGFGTRCKKSRALATAACPGESNHGRGLAVDVANVGLGGRLAWLEEHAERFGFSWELTSEPWHIRYTAGDRLPDAVLDPTPIGGFLMALSDEDQRDLQRRIVRLFDFLVPDDGAGGQPGSGVPTSNGELTRRIRTVDAGVAALLGRMPGDVQATAALIVDALDDDLAAAVAAKLAERLEP